MSFFFKPRPLLFHASMCRNASFWFHFSGDTKECWPIITKPVLCDMVIPVLSVSPNRRQNWGMTSGLAGGSTSPDITNGWNAAIDALVYSIVGFHRATVGYRFTGV